MDLRFIAVLLLFASLVSLTSYAHGLGGGQDKVVGNYLVDFGYSETSPVKNEPVLLTFVLRNSSSENMINFARARVMILSENDVLFSGNVKDEFDGQASITYRFPHDGNFTLRVRFNEKVTLAETEFSLAVGTISERKVGFEKRNSIYQLFKVKSRMLKLFNLPEVVDTVTTPSAEDSAKLMQETCKPSNASRAKFKTPCYVKEFEKLAFEHDHEFAFETLRVLQEQDEDASVCHLIAHGIGRGSYERNPTDWQNQIAVINPMCVYGAIHGVLEKYIYSLPEGALTKEIMLQVCETNPNPACIHAVGHLATVETGDELDEAIELCSTFPKTKGQRHYCLTGAFMEHMIADNLVQHGYYSQSRRTDWYKYVDDFEELCRSHDGEAATACWTEIIHASSIKFRGDAEKVFDLCNSAQVEAGAKLCKRHAVGDILSMKEGNLSQAKNICTIKQVNDSRFEGDCYKGLATSKLFSATIEEAREVAQFCMELKPRHSKVCFSQINKILTERSFSQNDFQEVCGDLPSGAKKLCLGD